MAISATRWKAVLETPFPWEREALQFIRDRLPDHDPYLAWANFEFIADDGSINEVDLLVLTPQGLFLVEIKSQPGVLTGDSGWWTWEHEGKRRTYDNPLLGTNRKAKKLKSLLQRQKAFRDFRGRIPYIEPLVFLSAENLNCMLQGTALTRVCLRDREPSGADRGRPGIMAAILRRECSGLPPDPKGVGNKPTAKALSRAMDEAGIRPSRDNRRVDSYELKELLLEGPGFQDWEATHGKVDDVKRRVRLYLAQRAATFEERTRIERAASREFKLLQALQHTGILAVHDIKQHPLGTALVFDHLKDAQRLDHFLIERGESLSLEARISLVRNIAEAVGFAHGKRIVHRSLSPQSILVMDPDEAEPEVKVFNWQVGTRADGSSTGAGGVTATVHVNQLVEDASTAYIAPEALRGGSDPGPAQDVFSLGALAYHVFSGQPPASDALDLQEKLRRFQGLRISDVLNGAGHELQDLVKWSTHPEVSSRWDSVADFLTMLEKVEEELTAPETDLVYDPSKAQTGDRIAHGYTIVKRMGTGGSAVAFLVQRGEEKHILKVAQDPGRNDHLRAEGEVLKQLRHGNIVPFIGIEDFGDRIGVIMKSAGEETLAQRLGKEGRLHTEMLHRFGEALLATVTYLEAEGIPHRDIKPHNIGVAERGHRGPKTIVLFDFSLSRTPAENIFAGTPAYMDPFLSLRKPRRWDLAAERFSAAMTLYEMATGTLPVWGDGKSDPALLDCEATIDPEMFETGLRDPLSVFFRKALRRSPAERHDNAEQMLDEWRKVFLEIDRPAPEEDDTEPGLEPELPEDLRYDTPVSELGLGTRAFNALDRANILDVGAFLRFPKQRIRNLRGVGLKTQREINAVLDAIRKRLPAPPPEEVPRPSEEGDATEEESLVGSIDMLLARITRPKTRGRGKPPSEDQAIQGILGLDEKLTAPWPTLADVGALLGKTKERIRQNLVKLRDRWAGDPSLSAYREETADILANHGGVLSADGLATIMLLARGSILDEPHRTMAARAVLRAALEAERGAENARFALHRHGTETLVAVNPDLADFGRRIGKKADDIASKDPLVQPSKVPEMLRAIRAPAEIAGLSDVALVKLAADVSSSAALSSRQELYPKGMEPLRALKLSRGALLGISTLTMGELRERVAGRYPEAAPLPDRPELDRLLEEAGVEVQWSEEEDKGRGAYKSTVRNLFSVSSGTPAPTRLSTLRGGIQPVDVPPEVADARKFEEKLDRAHKEGAFLSLMVAPPAYTLAREELVRRWPLDVVDLEALFLSTLKARAGEAGVKWELVLQADGKGPGTREWRNFMTLVSRTTPEVEADLARAKGTILLLHAGVLARYECLQILERLRDKTGRRENGLEGVWVLIPQDELQSLPCIDGVPVPVLGRGQAARVPEWWLKNLHGHHGYGSVKHD